jgi:hypothetical protein
MLDRRARQSDFVRERFEAPIVEDEELDAGETAQDAGIAAVTAGEREFGEELGNPLIENRAVVAAGLVTEGTRKRGPTGVGKSWLDTRSPRSRDCRSRRA